jgi:hypothetical protein
MTTVGVVCRELCEIWNEPLQGMKYDAEGLLDELHALNDPRDCFPILENGFPFFEKGKLCRWPRKSHSNRSRDYDSFSLQMTGDYQDLTNIRNRISFPRTRLRSNVTIV